MIVKNKPKVKLASVIKEFKEIAPTLNRECDYVINCGGCGIFADKTYKLFKKLGYEPKILVQLYWGQDPDAAVQNLKLGNGPSSMEWKHILVEVDGKVIDSEYVHNKKELIASMVVEGMTYELFKKWLSESGWNRCFDRKKYVPIINKHFKTIDKKLKEKANRTPIQKILSLIK
jgi:hypothetical protein